ncbi:MAG: hypothetical protein N3A66_11165, partial [Planctomycetota bacterium]|nr:hypothetical protein [Planctomycetota bacterium]
MLTRLSPTFAIIAALACALAAGEALPDLPDAFAPEVALPKEFADFAPPVHKTPPAAGAPIISEWTRTAGPDESVVLAGTGMDTTTRFIAFAQGRQQEIKARGVTPHGAVLTLSPEILPAWDVALIWPVNSAGAGAPAIVNRPEAWWLNPRQAARGEIVSLYGRNLSHKHGKEKSWILLKPEGKAGVWAEVKEVNPYKVDFAVPENLAPGVYEVWVHNGHGGRYGWHAPHLAPASKPTATHLTVADPWTWTGGEFDVKKYGAKGDGVSDDTAAIQAAFDRAAADQKFCIIPPGTWNVSATVTLPGPARGLIMQGTIRYT